MVRRKVEIKKIEDKSKRYVAFSKRRQGVFKKAKELCEKSGDEVAIVAFTLAGNMYAFGHPSVDSIVKRYEAEATEEDGGGGGGHAEHADVAIELTESVVEEEEEEEEEEGVVKEELDRLEKETEEMVKKVRDIITKEMVHKM